MLPLPDPGSIYTPGVRATTCFALPRAGAIRVIRTNSPLQSKLREEGASETISDVPRKQKINLEKVMASIQTV